MRIGAERRGCLLEVAGPSGGGKTTALDLLERYGWRPMRGLPSLEEHDPRRISREATAILAKSGLLGRSFFQLLFLPPEQRNACFGVLDLATKAQLHHVLEEVNHGASVAMDRGPVAFAATNKAIVVFAESQGNKELARWAQERERRVVTKGDILNAARRRTDGYVCPTANPGVLYARGKVPNLQTAQVDAAVHAQAFREYATRPVLVIDTGSTPIDAMAGIIYQYNQQLRQPRHRR